MTKTATMGIATTVILYNPIRKSGVNFRELMGSCGERMCESECSKGNESNASAFNRASAIFG
jgi:hypothetical protein